MLVCSDGFKGSGAEAYAKCPMAPLHDRNSRRVLLSQLHGLRAGDRGGVPGHQEGLLPLPIGRWPFLPQVRPWRTYNGTFVLSQAQTGGGAAATLVFFFADVWRVALKDARSARC